MSKLFFYLLGLFSLISFIISNTAFSDVPTKKPAQPLSTLSVSTALYHDVSLPLVDMKMTVPTSVKNHIVPLGRLPFYHSPVKNVMQRDTAIQTTLRLPLPVTPGVAMQGLGSGFVNADGTPYSVTSTPSDVNLDVGRNFIVQWVNTSFAVFDKAGRLLQGQIPGNTLWSGFPGRCATNNDGDPIVKYDRLANRWVMTQFVSSAPYRQCIAISQTEDPRGAYNRYEFDFGNSFNDYGKLGVWPDAYYMSFNIFQNNNFAGGQACAFERDKMLVGDASARMLCSALQTDSLLPADLDGTTLPPNGSPNYFAGFDRAGLPNPPDDFTGVKQNINALSSIHIWKMQVNWSNVNLSTFTGPTNILVRPFNLLTGNCGEPDASQSGNCVPQKGTTDKLSVIDQDFMYRLAYRNFGNYQTLLLNHVVNAGDLVAGVRWYEIRIRDNYIDIYQQSTYTQPDGVSRWYASIAMDKMGNIGLGYNASGSYMYPSVRYTGRVFMDQLNTMRSEKSIIEGFGSQLQPTSGTDKRNRWDDYTSLVVDPSDDCTFWYTAQYMRSTAESGNWSTYIGSFKFNNCR
ncbi:MAG: hypothetical protein P4M12_09440 [Gammaproteobacteria bacterium]|nr:hypothetical protein [Gammaproteobacteria bacterium]